MARKGRKPEQGTDVELWAQTLPDAYLLCRDIGHEWEPYRAWLDHEVSGYRRILRCRRCKCDRSQILTMSGHTTSASYDYPDGYQAPKGTGLLYGPDRDTLRLTSLLRLIDDSVTSIRAPRRQRRAS
jgi:hypothetical protein